MPEGHTIHRESRLQSRAFGEEKLRVWSPQGRFSEEAGLLDGQSLRKLEAWGKHLFYEWGSGQILHVHLGLFGRFRRYGTDPPEPTDGTRLAMASESATQYLSGPTICRLIDPVRREEVISRLGPDPLRPSSHDGAVDHIVEHLGRRTVPISAALLDQSVVSGLGNVYRSELLYRTKVHPLTIARELDRARIEQVWEEAVDQLRAGERTGRIITTDPEDVGRSSRSEIERGERTYVYKRKGDPCRRCDTAIESAEVAGRSVWWCPRCQAQ